MSVPTGEGNMTPASLSHIAEKLSGLLQQPHQAALGEVASGAHAVLVWGQDVIRHCRFLQHIGGDVLRGGKQPSQSIKLAALIKYSITWPTLKGDVPQWKMELI